MTTDSRAAVAYELKAPKIGPKRWQQPLSRLTGLLIMGAYVAPDADGFEGVDLSGLSEPLIRNLRSTCFRRASLYWANLESD